MSAPSSKYHSFRDSALHFLCNAGWGMESDGNSPEYGVYFSRISNTWEDVKPTNTEFVSLIEQWGEAEEDPALLTTDFYRSLVGHFLVSEDSQGFVHVRDFPTEDALIARFRAFQEHYASWAGDDDN